MNRAVMAARAAQRPQKAPNMRYFPVAVGTDRAAAPIRNRKSPRLTATQRDSRGMRSAWNRSTRAPYGGWR